MLARIIFIQFLIDRKDSLGKSALSESQFAALKKDGVLSESHADLESLLLNYDDTYSLFHHLDERFNGDLFPKTAGTRNSGKKNGSKKRNMSMKRIFTRSRILLAEERISRRNKGFSGGIILLM